MAVTLSLGLGIDGLDTLLIEAGKPPLTGRIDKSALDHAVKSLPALLKPMGGLLLPSHDVQAANNERQGATLLTAAIFSVEAQQIVHQLHRIAGSRRDSDGPLPLLIDVHAPELLNLPWELLEVELTQSPIPTVSIAHVVRAATKSITGKESLLIVPWSPTPEDVICQQQLHTLDQVLTRLQGVRCCSNSEFPEIVASAQELVVLHMVCHGVHSLKTVALNLEAGQQLASDSLARLLKPSLSKIDLIYLDVCSGASTEVEHSLTPAGALMALGPMACIAPQLAWSLDAAEVSCKAFYQSLQKGSSLKAAMQLMRSAVSGLAIAHPSCRWWTPQLQVAAQVDLEKVLIEPCEQLEGWASPSKEAGKILREAVRLGKTQGFVGIEHLLLALVNAAESTPRLMALKQPFKQLSKTLVHFGSVGDQNIRISPRLRSLGNSLDYGFSLDDLYLQVIQCPWVRQGLNMAALLHWSEDTVGSGKTTIDMSKAWLSQQVVNSSLADLRLEVEGGPEDGRIIELKEPGAVIGRYDADVHTTSDSYLYVDAVAIDRTVSRKQLRFCGADEIEVLVPIRLERGLKKEVIAAKTRIRIYAEDRLILGAATQLRVLT